MYIDPGSTNFIIQILIGAVAGAGLAIATFWRRIVSLFSRKKAGPESPTPAAGVDATGPPSAERDAAPPPDSSATVQTPPSVTDAGGTSDSGSG